MESVRLWPATRSASGNQEREEEALDQFSGFPLEWIEEQWIEEAALSSRLELLQKGDSTAASQLAPGQRTQPASLPT